jgi:hypothetical protein
MRPRDRLLPPLLQEATRTLGRLTRASKDSIYLHTLCFTGLHRDTPDEDVVQHINTTLQAVVEKWRKEDEAIPAAAGPHQTAEGTTPEAGEVSATASWC